jgi:hypothetical protein
LPAYFVDLPATWQEFYARIAGKVRKGIRRSYEIVEEDGLKLELRIIDAINELDEALERFYKLHTARALADDMSAHRDSFQNKKHATFNRTCSGPSPSRDLHASSRCTSTASSRRSGWHSYSATNCIGIIRAKTPNGRSTAS